jgi:Carboxypeptidase regulatory-like domain
MAAARIAAVAVALLAVALPSVQLSAQPTPQGTLTIQVTDITGAVIPGARLEIDPSPSKPESALTTDNQGRVALDLPGGAHKLSVSAPGFNYWTREIDVQSGGGQLVTAKLDIAEAESGGPIFASQPDVPLGAPEPVFIPLQPLLNLDPLPSRQAKKRW